MLQSNTSEQCITNHNTHSQCSALEATHLDVTLSSQVVYLSGFDFIDNLHQAGAVSEITVVQLHVFRV